MRYPPSRMSPPLQPPSSPLASMTGQGAASATRDGVHADVSLASVNRKQLEILVTLPHELSALEPDVHAAIRRRFLRGRIYGDIRITASLPPSSPDAPATPLPDPASAARIIAALRDIAAATHLPDDLSASHLLLIPDLIPSAAPPPPSPDRVRPALLDALDAALDRLQAFRRHEGATLADDLRRRLDALAVLRAQIAARAPAVAADFQSRLTRRITDALAAAEIPPSSETLERVIRETAIYAEHADIAEELTRLASHLDQARALLSPPPPDGRSSAGPESPGGPPAAHTPAPLPPPGASAPPIQHSSFSIQNSPSLPASAPGRTLDFLAQELGREINTIGSKANDADISHAVIAFKAELERFREQAQNIE